MSWHRVLSILASFWQLAMGDIPKNDVSRRCLGSAAAADIAFRFRNVDRGSLVEAIALGLASSCIPASGAGDVGVDYMVGEVGLELEL